MKLTKAQQRIVLELLDGKKLFWSVSFNSYFIGVPGAEHNSRHVRQLTVYELKAKSMVNGLLELSPAGLEAARELKGGDDGK